MSLSAVRNEFNEWAGRGRGEEMARGHRDVTLQALDRMTFSSGDIVLDVGCGIAWTGEEIHARGARFVAGIDASEAMLSRAPREGWLGVALAGADALPFGDATFNWVISVEALYYVADLDGALREIRRVCRPGARFACIVDLFRDNEGSLPWVEALNVPVHVLSAAGYRDRFLEAGFRVVETTTLQDRRPIKSPQDFEPSEWFPSYDDYREFRRVGSLLIEASV